MNLWIRYKEKVKKNFGISQMSGGNLDYWRNVLFVYTIIYIIPFSVIAYIPGVLFSIAVEAYYITAVDTIAVILLLIIGFMPDLAIHVRKFLFGFCLYFIGINLLYYIGLVGPGLIYLLVITFFAVIIFPSRFAYYPAFINLGICIVFSFLIHFEVLPWVHEMAHNLPHFIAVSSNLVFLGFLTSALIPVVFDGLQHSLDQERKTNEALDQQKLTLEKTLGQLQIKNQELEMFAFTASHDLQEPLRMITSFLSQLEKKYGETIDDKGKEYIHFAVDGAHRMRQIILDLLEFSQVGAVEGKREWIDMQSLLKEVLQFHTRNVQAENANIHIGDLPQIYAYRSPTMQVFQNLIGNALKYTRKGVPAEISITAEETETFWKFAVRDNGIGIDSEYFDKIFVIFQRLHAKDEYSGTGIGLAIVRKIIESLGGKIWVESEEGKGSVFYFILPKENRYL